MQKNYVILSESPIYYMGTADEILEQVYLFKELPRWKDSDPLDEILVHVDVTEGSDLEIGDIVTAEFNFQVVLENGRRVQRVYAYCINKVKEMNVKNVIYEEK